MIVLGTDLSPNGILGWPEPDLGDDLASVLVRLKCCVGGVNPESPMITSTAALKDVCVAGWILAGILLLLTFIGALRGE